MMDREDIEELVRGMLAERDRRAPVDDEDVVQHMMPVEPFDAETFNDEPVRVVGIAYRNDALEWVAAQELEGGELIPVFEGSVWRKKAA